VINKFLEKKRGQKLRDKMRHLLRRKFNRLNKRKKTILELMKFSWQWCRLSINLQPKKMKLEIKKILRDQILPNLVEVAVREEEVVVVANEVTEEAWLSNNEMINKLVRKIGRLSQRRYQNKKDPHLMISSILPQRIKSQKKRSLKLNKRNQRPLNSLRLALRMSWKPRTKR